MSKNSPLEEFILPENSQNKHHSNDERFFKAKIFRRNILCRWIRDLLHESKSNKIKITTETKQNLQRKIIIRCVQWDAKIILHYKLLEHQQTVCVSSEHRVRLNYIWEQKRHCFLSKKINRLLFCHRWDTDKNHGDEIRSPIYLPHQLRGLYFLPHVFHSWFEYGTIIAGNLLS